MKLICAVSVVSLCLVGITRRYKTVVLHSHLLCFYHIRLTYMLPGSKAKPSIYWNFTSGFDFDHVSLAACDFSFGLPNFIRIYDVIPIFQDGGHRVGNLLPVSCLVSLKLKKMKDYPCSNFSPIYYLNTRPTRDITTFGF